MNSIFGKTLSLSIAFESLKSLDRESMPDDELGFIVTCMRDNVKDFDDSEELVKVLDLMVHKLHKS